MQEVHQNFEEYMDRQLSPPLYGYQILRHRKPTLSEVVSDWLDAINFLKDRSRFIIFVTFLHYVITLPFFVYFVSASVTANELWAMAFSVLLMGTVYNTVWFHRYCSHRAFKFRSLWPTRLFLWTNPIVFREEIYVVTHRIHHNISDQYNDLHGPRYGFLGNWARVESFQRLNLAMTQEHYQSLCNSLRHIGFPFSAYSTFARYGSIENIGHFFARLLFSNVFWIGVSYWLFAERGPIVWYASLFLFTSFYRDFPYRGHIAPFMALRGEIKPTNHFFYGYLASEWHGNHHDEPHLARSGYRWWELDLAYYTIKALKACGIVSQYHGKKRE